jgi:DNA-binding NarL/FixJ family response regulator
MNNDLPYIVLADDDPDDREALIHPFVQQNPNVRIVVMVDGEELLHFLENCPDDALPVLILMDYKMPILTAAEILEKLAGDDRYSEITKLVWSTSDRAEYVDRCVRYGATTYFAKPCSLAELETIVDRMTRTFKGIIAT